MRREWLAALVGAAVGWLAADRLDKTAGVRLFDVVLLGPFLVLAALDPSPSRFQRCALAVAGGATMAYNLKNYLGQVKEEGA